MGYGETLQTAGTNWITVVVILVSDSFALWAPLNGELQSVLYERGQTAQKPKTTAPQVEAVYQAEEDEVDR